MEKYEDPTQRLHSKFPSQEYRDNYDKIFGKKKYWYEKQLELDLGEIDVNSGSTTDGTIEDGTEVVKGG
jgi:hypothetical protein